MSVYISEFNVYSANGGDFTEVVAPAGTDVSAYSVYIYDSSGYVCAGPFPLGSAVTTISGKDVYVIDEHNDGISISAGSGIALVDGDGNAVQYLSDPDYSTIALDGPIAGTATTDAGDWNSSSSMQSDDGGVTYYNQSVMNKGTVPCFASGTMIACPDQARRVDTLRDGDVVCTPDNGRATIKWVQTKVVPVSEQDTANLPVLISRGALGYNRPSADLIVSANHRVLVGSAGQLDAVFQTACFVPAKALTCLPGVRVMLGRTQVTWCHFACENHEAVISNGCVTESLLLGDMALSGMTHVVRSGLQKLYEIDHRDPGTALNGSPRFPILPVGLARATINEARRAKRAAWSWSEIQEDVPAQSMR